MNLVCSTSTIPIACAPPPPPLAAPTPPDPERLGERERRQWLMLTAQLCGTGNRWRPLADALALLWQASARRDELRQLLPWALPVPLRVHGRTSRAEIEAAFGILRDDAPWIHREGVLWHEPSQSDLLLATRPGPRPVPVPLGEPEHHHRRFPHRAENHPP